MLMSLEWPIQQTLVSDSVYNARQKDETALRSNYVCKLVYLMKDYDVFAYADNTENFELIKILSDPRFRRDSYYIEAIGTLGPLLIDWIKTNTVYVRLARTQMAFKKRSDSVKVSVGVVLVLV